jgi:hypothetical protein
MTGGGWVRWDCAGIEHSHWETFERGWSHRVVSEYLWERRRKRTLTVRSSHTHGRLNHHRCRSHSLPVTIRSGKGQSEWPTPYPNQNPYPEQVLGTPMVLSLPREGGRPHGAGPCEVLLPAGGHWCWCWHWCWHWCLLVVLVTITSSAQDARHSTSTCVCEVIEVRRGVSKW